MDINKAQEYSAHALRALQEASSSVGYNFQKSKKRSSRYITDKKTVDYFLSIDHEAASKKETIMDLFANFGDGSLYNPYDLIDIPAHAYGGLSKSSSEYNKQEAQSSSTKTNSSKFTTTLGLWIFNRSFIEPLSDVFGYINESITGDVYGDLNKKLSYALLEDKVTVRQLKNFIIQSQILMSCCSALCPSHTETFFAMEEQIAKKKAELEKQYKDALNNADLVTMKKMEKELIDYAKDILKDDEGRDMYDSGARASYSNNFKNMYLMRSGIKKTDGSVKIVTSSYIEGMDQKDFADINDASIGGPYSRSRLTASGGYVERLVLNSTSHLKILPEGSDCGTKDYILVELTAKNVKDWYFSYIISGSNLIELLPENASKYIGTTVKMRYSALCKAKNGCICEKCAGSLFRRMGIEAAGMTSSIMASSMKNANMKRFHNNDIKLTSIDPVKVFNLG